MGGRGKGSRPKRQNGNSSSSSSAPSNVNVKVFQSLPSQPCKKCEDLKVSSSQKLAEMESQIDILQAALRKFESKMDNQLVQQVKIGEQLSVHLMEVDKEFRQQLAKRDEEYEVQISKALQQLQEAEERFKNEISEKEEDCRAVISDKRTLESSVLQLTEKIKVISEQFEESCKAWELEKDGLFSQIVAAQKETQEIAKATLIAEQAWNVDRENILSSYDKKNEDMSTLNQRVLLEKNELESQLNDSKARTRELLENFEDDRHLWGSEKQKLQANAAELQIKIDSMATEKGMLCQENIALSSEVESLKSQLNENIARLAQMEDKRVQNESVLQQCRTKNYLEQKNDSKGTTQDLLRKNEEDTNLWDAEKSNLEGIIIELRAKHELMASKMGSVAQINRELTVEAEVIKHQVNAWESKLNESRKRTQELLQQSEEDRHLWDERKSNLERTLAEQKTVHDDLMLQLSRNKALEEELLSTRSSLEEMKESNSKGEVQIANLKSQLLAVEEEKDEKDSQLSDIQRKLWVMEDERDSQLGRLQCQVSYNAAAKNLFLEKYESLRTEMDRNTLVTEEKERQFVDLQNRHSHVVEIKKWLEEKNESLHTELETALDSLKKDYDSKENELNRCTMVSEENVRLQNRISELETELDSLKEDYDSKENELNRCTMVSEENVRLQNRISELETERDSLKEDYDSKENELNRCTMVSEENVRLQNRISKLETELDSLKEDYDSKENVRRPAVSLVHGNEKQKRNHALHEKRPPNVAPKMSKPKPKR